MCYFYRTVDPLPDHTVSNHARVGPLSDHTASNHARVGPLSDHTASNHKSRSAAEYWVVVQRFIYTVAVTSYGEWSCAHLFYDSQYF